MLPSDDNVVVMIRLVAIVVVVDSIVLDIVVVMELVDIGAAKTTLDIANYLLYLVKSSVVLFFINLLSSVKGILTTQSFYRPRSRFSVHAVEI